MVGLIAAGLEKCSNFKVPKEIALNIASDTLMLEQRNRAMNTFVGGLIEKMRNTGLYSVLLKGQGIARCYERPLWRSCGDIDLLLNEDNYIKAKNFLIPLSKYIDKEHIETKHSALTIDFWEVELHGTLKTCLWRCLDRGLDEVNRSVFYGGKVRSWMNDRTQVFLPGSNEDVIIIFTHILQHFFMGGIGLRQVCDWCRLLWTYNNELDYRLLNERLCQMGIMSEWKAFSALAVDYLGMRPDDIPYYSPKGRWSKKADRVLSYIIETGNFGHNRDISYQSKYPPVIRKVVTFWRQAVDSFRLMGIFPLDALRSLFNYGIRGTKLHLNKDKL